MRKKVVAVLCGFGCILGTVTPSFAAEKTATQPGNVEVPVTFEQGSTFTVTLPEQVSGASGQTSAGFQYSVKGNIASNQHVDISVEDADASTDGAQAVLTDVAGNTKYATVAIDKESYAYDEINSADGMTSDGSVTFSGLTAGTWTGNAKFVIGLN